MMEFKYLILVLFMGLFTTAYVRGVEDEHKDDKCGETLDPFTQIKEAVNTTKDELDAEALEEIVHHIMERFDCENMGCKVRQDFHTHLIRL